MTHIKLKEFCEQNSITYITGYRWFKNNQIPGAYQTDSGTILIPCDKDIKSEQSGDAMSLFLKKTVEFSKNNSSVEDFAAYIISNFQLKLNNVASDSPKYSKNKPKPEEMQKHFQQFLPDKEEVERLKNVKTMITTGKDLSGNPVETITFDEARVLFSADTDVSEANADDIDLAMSTGGLVAQSVDFNTTPQQINYTGSTSQSSSSFLSFIDDGQSSLIASSANAFAGQPTWDSQPLLATYLNCSTNTSGVPFNPTQRELLSSAKVIETAETLPRKRGRKPSIKRTQ